MPNIIPRGRRNEYQPLSLDVLRADPGRLFTRRDLALLGIVDSHDGVRSLIEDGVLPAPHRLGGKELWEGRAILRMFGEAGTPDVSAASDHAQRREAA